MVEHSERESHLTPPLDALQWTIFSPVTIQHQNRQIKITSHPRPIDGARAPAGAAQLSHQTLTGFGSRPILRCASAQTRQRIARARCAVSSGALRFSRRTPPFIVRGLSLRALPFHCAHGAVHCTRGRRSACVCHLLRAAREAWRRRHTHHVAERRAIAREARTTPLVNLVSRDVRTRGWSMQCAS